MVELGQQSALLFLDPFALGYVNADAHDSVWAPFAVKGKETARLDPSQLASRTNDTILYVVFAPASTECLTAGLFYPSYVVGMHTGQAFATRYLGGNFRKAVDRSITSRDSHDLCIGVISVGANEPSLGCQGKLYVALGQCLFRLFALCNVDLGSDPLYWLPSFVVKDEDARLDPPHLTVAEYPIFDDELSVAIGEGAASDEVQLREIIRMHPRAPIFS